ncbi:MAG: hypothetical protein ACI33K_07460 [Clostridiaceae bacterium]
MFGNSCGNNFDVCTILPFLIILSKSKILKDDNTFILLLLFWLCGGVNAIPKDRCCTRVTSRCRCRCRCR